MRIKYSIHDLEKFWSANDFDQADQILSKNRYPVIKQIKKGFYTVEFEDIEQVEVEVLLSNRKVVKHTCDCSIFLEEKRCNHILAGLILIRKSETKRRKRQQTTKQLPTSLNINQILNEASPTELRLFARDYARQDYTFALLLKARFIRNIILENDEEKYDLLFNQLIRIDRSGKVNLNRLSKKTLILVIESLVFHFDETIVDRQFREAFLILSSILRRMHTVIDRNEAYALHFKDSVVKAYAKFNDFVRETIPPELKQEAFQLCFKLASRSQFHILDLYYNAISVAQGIGKEMNLTESLYNLLDDKRKTNEKQRISWHAVTALLCYHEELSQEAKSYFHKIEQSEFASMVEFLSAHHEYESILWLMQEVDLSVYRDRNKVRVYMNSLEASERQQNYSMMQFFGMELMMLKKDISFLKRLQLSLGISIGKVEREAEYRILNELDGDIQARLLAEFYISTGKQADLLQILIQQNDIDFFIKHDVHVLPALKFELTEAYMNIIEDHLSHYAGNVNVELIQKWKQHFEDLNLTNEIEEVLTKLQDAHPERQILFNQIKKR